MTLRCIRSFLVLYVALFFALVAYGNVTDYQTNWQFVHHVLKMDTIFKASLLPSRAITNLNLQKTLYCLIITTEGLSALILFSAGLIMLKNKKKDNQYKRAKNLANLGLFLAFTLYFVGFIIVGGEWFAMWQSQRWNGQATAGLFATLIMLIFIFINLSE